MLGAANVLSVLPRLGVAAVAAYALATLLAASPARPSPPAVPPPVPTPSELLAARRWSVSVDGWRIEVDGVLPSADEADGGGEEEAPEPPAPVPEMSSPYDPLIVRYAEATGLDWRLVSAIIFEESGFRPHVESTAGAYGLMQVRPIAAEQIGESEYREPEANIRAGTRYLEYLSQLFSGASGENRLALMLAAYNMGPSHVQDAQLLARRVGLDPLRWDGAMAVAVQLLEESSVCTNLPSGCAYGSSVVDYVERVLDRFAVYRRTRPALPYGIVLGALDG